MERWRKLVGPIRAEGIVSYALVAVDAHGEVFYGSDFGHDNGSALLARLTEIEHDIKVAIARGHTA